MDPEKLIRKAQESSFYLWLLNVSLSRIIPFNKPHRIKVSKVEEDQITTKLPYRRSNFNHIRGLHACGIATLAEFTTGLNLLRKLDSRKYRIIMKDISVEYFFQGKKDAFATFKADQEWLNTNVFNPLQGTEKVDIPVQVEVRDTENQHLATAKITWQVKDWEKVKTKV